jgi:hypothetical protein
MGSDSIENYQWSLTPLISVIFLQAAKDLTHAKWLRSFVVLDGNSPVVRVFVLQQPSRLRSP